MAHQMLIALPDDQFQHLLALAANRGMTPEELAATWVIERQNQEAIRTEVFPGIVSDPGIHQGAPVIAGTRIQAVLIADLVNSGELFEEINTDYGLSPEQVQAAVDYARRQGV